MREDELKQLIETMVKIEKLAAQLSVLKYTLETANTIWKRCPFQVGDIVKLLNTPEISQTQSWGWLGAQHFLVEGATAVVVMREFSNGQFYFGLHFDGESWIDTQGVKHVSERKSIYSFSENWLVHA